MADQFHYCKLCDKSFSNKNSLKRHNLVHSGEKAFVCEFCDKAFSLKQNLNKHRVIHTNDGAFVCTTCGKSFAVKSDLDYHSKIHSDERPFRCPTCGRSFKQKHDLMVHQQIHMPDRPKNFVCPVCFHAFDKHSKLRDHMYKHEPKHVTYACNECGQVYEDKKEYQAHAMMHVEESMRPIEEQRPKPFTCDYCIATFYHKAQVEKHVSRCHTFFCAACDDDVCMPDKDQFDMHVISHKQNQPSQQKSQQKQQQKQSSPVKTEPGKKHSCNICGREFSSKDMLGIHEMIHLPTNNSVKQEPLENVGMVGANCLEVILKQEEIKEEVNEPEEKEKGGQFFV